MLTDLTYRGLKVEDFATLLVHVWFTFGSRLVELCYIKSVPYSRTERSNQSSNLNNYENKIKI